MADPELICSEEAFRQLRTECGKIICIDKRLPSFVFTQSFDKYFAIEYNYIFKRNFGEFLFNISNITKDESINYMILDPDPTHYHDRWSSAFGLVSFKPEGLKERYVPVMAREQKTPKLLVSVNVGVFWGSSLKWGIFCDRISWELAVIAVPQDVDVPAISGFRCMDASWLSSYEQSQYFTKPHIALDFVKKFSANYAI